MRIWLMSKMIGEFLSFYISGDFFYSSTYSMLKNQVASYPSATCHHGAFQHRIWPSQSSNKLRTLQSSGSSHRHSRRSWSLQPHYLSAARCSFSSPSGKHITTAGPQRAPPDPSASLNWTWMALYAQALPLAEMGNQIILYLSSRYFIGNCQYGPALVL